MRRALVLACLALVACGGGLADNDKANLANAARLDAMAYRYQDAAAPSAALVRGAYCATSAVIRDQNLPAIDAGIACAP